MALGAIMSEMDFVWKVSTKYRRKGPRREESGVVRSRGLARRLADRSRNRPSFMVL